MAKSKTSLLTWVLIGTGLALVVKAVGSTNTPQTATNNGMQPIVLPPQPTMPNTYPIVYMKFNEDAKLLQQALGFTGGAVDGVIGPNTLKKIQAKLPGYPQSFVIADYAQLQRLINAIK